MRPLLVRSDAGVMLSDAGIGDKMDDKSVAIYGIDRQRNLQHSLSEAGLSADHIDIVLASHLHFDHAGGFTARDSSGSIRPVFPRARYVARTAEWEDATHPHERNRASYLAEKVDPLAVDLRNDNGHLWVHQNLPQPFIDLRRKLCRTQTRSLHIA